MLEGGLHHGGQHAQQCGARCHAHGRRLSGGLCQSEGIEAGTALIGHPVALYVRALLQIVHDRSVAAARTHHHMAHSVVHEQGGQDVYAGMVGIHGRD